MASQSDPTYDTTRVQLRLRYRERLDLYRSVNADLSDLSWTLADLEQQIATLSTQAGDLPDTQQERRVSDLRRWKESLEETILQQMYRTEALAAEVAELRLLLKDELVDSSE